MMDMEGLCQWHVLEESGLHTMNYFSKILNVPWWYHGLAQGWHVVESDYATKPMVGWKNTHIQSVWCGL
jgi:hypothetical protein